MSVPPFEAVHLNDFEGQWQLERKITPSGSADIHFSGVARWVPEAENMRYREEGQLLLTGQAPMHAEREYIWTPDLKVYFPDGRFFHSVATDGTEAEHWCDPDTYIGTYDFTELPTFTVTWHVSGPRKDYRSLSRYLRL